MRRGPILILTLIALVAWTIYSYSTAGLVYALVNGTPEHGQWLEQVRQIVAGWGRLGPLIYTLAVIVEVVVAPIPGPLLYAPAGAIFGGFLGGTLSLIGNVVGAAIAAALGALIGERIAAKNATDSRFARYRERLQNRGFWVVLLLRANPLTSSDLVSYAAGLARVPIWKVAAGTLIGMAPLCYLQSYFAQRVFEVVPGWALILSAVALVIILAAVVLIGRSRSGTPVAS